jgi:hypothetical protein
VIETGGTSGFPGGFHCIFHLKSGICRHSHQKPTGLSTGFPVSNGLTFAPTVRLYRDSDGSFRQRYHWKERPWERQDFPATVSRPIGAASARQSGKAGRRR